MSSNFGYKSVPLIRVAWCGRTVSRIMKTKKREIERREFPGFEGVKLKLRK